MILRNTGRVRRVWSEKRKDAAVNWHYSGMCAVGFSFAKQPRIRLTSRMHKGALHLWYSPCYPFVRSKPLRLEWGSTKLYRMRVRAGYE